MAKPQKVMIMPHVRVVDNLRIVPQQFPKSPRADSDLHVYLFSLLESFLYKILVLLLSDTFYRKFMGMS